LGVGDVKFIYTDGSVSINKTIQDTLDASVSNYLQALAAASLADTGVWHNNSTFCSSDFLNLALQVSAAIYLHTLNQSYYPNYYQINQPFVNMSRVGILMMNPFPIMGTGIDRLESSAIPVGYTHHVQWWKHNRAASFVHSISSLFLSRADYSTFPSAILVADLSLFSTFWGLFCLVVLALAKAKASSSCNFDG
jgi:hypothetical protein